MRIAIDLQACQSESRFRGIGRYSMSLSKAMIRQADEHEIWIVLNGCFPYSIAHIRNAFQGLLPQDHIVVFSHPTPTAEMIKDNDWRVRVGECLREHFLSRLNPDIVHVASLFEGWIDDAVTSVGSFDYKSLTAITLYDLIPIIYRDAYLSEERMRNYHCRKIRSLYNADILLAISEYSKQEALSILNLPESRITTISSAIEDGFCIKTVSPVERRKILNRYGINKAFVMCVPGGFENRKNINRLIEAYSQLPNSQRQSHQLVIASRMSEEHRLALCQCAQNQGLAIQEMILTGYVPDEDLVTLLNLCKLFVFPSLHEGFGLPVLEAMACGAPVIGSSETSIPEVIGRKDALFNPHRTYDLTRAIYKALNNAEFRRSLREHGTIQAAKFTWDESARRALEAFEAIHKERLAAHRISIPFSDRKKKLAFVSPLPPEKSGIADYSADLLPELARYYDITLIIDQKKIEPFWMRAIFSIKDIEWFKSNAKCFDRVLYHFGNSPFHKHMFVLIDEYPGVVVLHDFYLSSVLHWMEDTGYVPGCFTNALYRSHGYNSLADNLEGVGEKILSWPCNKAVLDNAAGVIVHSKHAIEAAEKWYSPAMSRELRKIPQLIRIPKTANRAYERTALKFSEDCFLVCSFGMLGPNKLNDRLLVAWITSELANDPRCYLVFVGQNHGGDYGQALLSKIQENRLEDRVRITGFASKELYESYLGAADVAVQLRTNTRGETSRAVLEAMAHGLPVVMNANGPMAEYPEDIQIKLTDDFSDSSLVEALERLRHENTLRTKIGQAGKEFVSEIHSPEKIGFQYYQTIEYFYKNVSRARYQQLLTSLGTIEPCCGPIEYEPSEQDLSETAKALAFNAPPPRQKNLFLDISTLVEKDLKTGIERVTRSIMLEMLKCPPEGFRVEPVYRDKAHYRYASTFTIEKLGISVTNLPDSVIDVQSGDIYLSLEWNPALLIDARSQLQYLRDLGVDLFFIVFDLLPLQLPDCFPPPINMAAKNWLEIAAEISTGLICISRSVAIEVNEWLTTYPPTRYDPLSVGYFHLGADIENSAPTKGLPSNSPMVLDSLKKANSFLMVGTIEPRKGYLQTLEAFTQLWKDGFDANLVIVGKEGWKDLPEDQRRTIPEILVRLRSHPERDRHLFWLEGISDEFLDKVYSVSTCLIAASEGEGFGLPLIEAAIHDIPVIARDIPVFREVAGESGFYFEGNSASNLVNTIKQWICRYERKEITTDAKIKLQTWKESSGELSSFVTGRKIGYYWVSSDLRDKAMAEHLSLIHQARKNMVQMHLPPGEIILDLGGANCPLYKMGYRHPFKRLVLIDLPPEIRHEHFKNAEIESNQANGEVIVKYTDMTKLDDIEDESVDLVWAGQSIEHVSLEDGIRMCRSAYRVLKKGGNFCLDTPNRLLTEIHLRGSDAEYIHSEHCYEYTSEELIDILDKSGFEIKLSIGVCEMNNTLFLNEFRYEDFLIGEMFSDDVRRGYIQFHSCIKR